jgi:DNA-binding GntR family transcriptional regulator
MTLSDELFEKILASIYASELPPGAVVNEAALAERYGVSRGPVREAVRRLQGIRLVSREPYMRASVVTLTGAEVLELFQVREALEGMACRLAAQHMSDDDLARFGADLEAARQARINPKPKQKPVADFDFHERIVRASRNSRIADALCGDLYHLLRIYRRRSGAVPERKDAAHGEHWQIFRALKSRDGELAESLMRSHIARAAHHVVARLREFDANAQPHNGARAALEARAAAAS